jgi:hypothetical protein
MNVVATTVRELWGLFVDDGSLAFALIVWCGAAGLILPQLRLPEGSSGPVLFVGCLAILFGDIAVSLRRSKER